MLKLIPKILIIFLWALQNYAFSNSLANPPAPGKQDPNLSDAAAWELRLLGVDTREKLRKLQKSSSQREVILADVGTGGVSKSLLAERATIEYRMGPNFPDCDPHNNTHDTEMLNIILDITNALNIKVKVLVYQPAADIMEICQAFSQALQEADLVCFYQSYWSDVDRIVAALRTNDKVLLLSPYVETGPPTNQTPQGYAHHPWGEGIDHFVTVAPLAKKSNGDLTGVSDRDSNDTEIINFIAPSYYANSSGVTCPSAAVAVAVACYIYASSPTKPTPQEVISLMRRTSVVNEKLIAATPPFSRETVVTFKKFIKNYIHTDTDHRRKLDAPGLLNLYNIFLKNQK